VTGPPDGPHALPYARFYAAELGLRVVPIPRGTKRPSIAAWVDEGTTDLARIDAWWSAAPSHGVGIVTGQASGVFVVDVDEHGPASGSDTLADLQATYELLPVTPVVLTGGGGQHIYFAWPPGAVIRNDAGRLLGPGLDVRAEGGQVVAPPSIHATGERYVWEVTQQPASPSALFGMDPGTVPFALPPPWLVDLLTQPPPERPARPKATGERRLPGQQWAAETDWGSLLTADGAMYLRTINDRQGGTYELWSRPGLDGDHASATLGYRGSDVLKVFTSNWPGLTEGETYTKFGYFAATQHGGDFSAARAALEAHGYVTAHVELAELVATRADDDTTPDPAKLGVLTLRELVEADEPTYDWLVPGLIERGDRVLITGDEGYGKSTLLRQLGLAAAAGLNPFAQSPEQTRHPPCRVLLVDCENSERQLRREFPKALGALGGLDAVGDRFALAVRSDGLVLDDPKDTARDRATMLAMCDLVRPDLLLIGPLYKLLGGDPNAEPESRNLVLFLDRLRGEHATMALVVEAHAPHGQQRPYGWSGYKRWPEFGLHLTAEGALRAFRGGRDTDRVWPLQLRRGSGDEWLWMPAGAGATSPSDSPGGAVVDLEAEYAARVQQIVLRVLRAADRPLSLGDIIERAARRRAAVTQALRHFQDTGWLVVGREDRTGGDGKARSVEVFSLSADGPAGDAPD
jgi:Bifunctional DNA primase/polymerase, N-terminal/AAA domain